MDEKDSSRIVNWMKKKVKNDKELVEDFIDELDKQFKNWKDKEDKKK